MTRDLFLALSGGSSVLLHAALDRLHQQERTIDRKDDCIAAQREQLREARRLMWMAVMLVVATGASHE